VNARMSVAARFVVLFAAVAANGLCASGLAAPRFEIHGSAKLAAGAEVARSGLLQLTARLGPQMQRVSAPPPSTGRFALGATLTAAATTCYADTIFRDDFDADGF